MVVNLGCHYVSHTRECEIEGEILQFQLVG